MELPGAGTSPTRSRSTQAGASSDAMEEMPVLLLGRRPAVLLFLVEPLDLESIEERHCLVARECRYVVLGRPGIAVAEQLTREPALGCDRLADPAPHVAERIRPAEEQAEARPDEIDAVGSSMSSILDTTVVNRLESV